MHPLFTIQSIRQENTYQNHRVWCDCSKGCLFPPNHRLSHSQWIYHWPPPSLSHDALRFNLLLPAQQKLGTKVTLLLPIQKIDKDEGYSPSPSSTSNFCDQNSLFILHSFLGLAGFFSRLWIFLRRSLLSTTLPYFPSSARLCVAQIPQSMVRSGSLIDG